MVALKNPLKNILGDKEEKFKQLIRNSFDMIVLLDEHGVQRYVSDSCEKILGYRPDELMDVPVIDYFIHPDDREKVRSGLKGILENEAHGGAQYRHRHKNGSWVYLEAVGTNQVDNPMIRAVVLNVRDITQRRNAEKALRESETRLSEMNAAKDRIFSIIGHDLRSPFNSIIGFSDLLLEQIKNKDYTGVEEYAGIIQRSSLQAMDLLSNLLEWSRSQTGNYRFDPDRVEINQMVRDVVGTFGETARQKGLNIDLELDFDGPVYADQYMIGTVLRNLVSNGIKFTQPGGEISIGTERSGIWLNVRVSDSGVGISEEDQTKLFRVDQYHTTTGTDQESGTGLGLLLCREFVERHGGRIWVESEPGKGSLFRFTIPIGVEHLQNV
ncbi:MAG: PAS domain-containing sensor histidine kinase [Bacteroidota bacterium]